MVHIGVNDIQTLCFEKRDPRSSGRRAARGEHVANAAEDDELRAMLDEDYQCTIVRARGRSRVRAIYTRTVLI